MTSYTKRRKRQAGANAALEMIWFIIHVVMNVFFYAFAVFIIYRACIFAYDFTFQIFGDTTVDEKPGVGVEIVIPEGTSTMELASKLEMNRLVKNRYSFYLKVKLLSYNILAGTYHLNSSMTYDEILSTITDYSNAIEYYAPTPMLEEGEEITTEMPEDETLSDLKDDGAAGGDNTADTEEKSDN